MKNTTTKHHALEENMKKDSEYSIQYTMSPERSYLVKPKEGEIDYAKCGKNVEKFAKKVGKQKVESIEIDERKSKTTKHTPARKSKKKTA